MNRFERVSKYDESIKIPQSATTDSAGFDLTAAADIVIPSLWLSVLDYYGTSGYSIPTKSLIEVKQKLNYSGLSPMLVPTGIKIQLESNFYLSLSARSSLPLNSLLIVANAPGIIDADYYNNPQNEGEIFIQLLNLSPYNILIQKGDRIAQGVISEYFRTDTPSSTQKRKGGHGSSGG